MTSTATAMSSYLVQPDLRTPPPEDKYDIAQIPFSFALDPFQQHAISAIQQEHNVLVCAKTGSGKTLVGEYQIHYSLAKGKRIFYTTPIKSLSNQKFHDLAEQYPGASVGIMTGDIKFRPDAQIIVMTTEILRNLLYKRGTQTENLGLTASLSLTELDAVIFDECHYINDPDRGKVWEETMILLPADVKLIMLSATLDRPEHFADWLGELKQRPIHLIQTQYRIVPLTHTLYHDGHLQTILDPAEAFNDRVYSDWIRARTQTAKAHDRFQETVRNARLQGQEGAVAGKVHTADFTHTLNELVGFLNTRASLPALFFVLSRAKCEEYARRVSHDLLTSSETAAVTNIIGFHLSRYKSLETMPQFHLISDLLKRGIAFHHSGLLPLLKEIVEILFTKGLVRLLFATETFAVGLNMPTKTVVFTGLMKYDDRAEGMRLLRTDEYIQMAGRAGRRGKDTEGLVIYHPDRTPVSVSELRQIMKGNRQPVQSRMDFHYDFLLKTMQTGSLRWLNLMKQTYWFRQRQEHMRELREEFRTTESAIVTLESQVSADAFREIEVRKMLEQRIKQSVNQAKREAQRELGQWDNKHMGAKWATATRLYPEYHTAKTQVETIHKDLETLEACDQQLQPVIAFLRRAEFITMDDALPTEELSATNLTHRGILATEVNEGHPIMMPELFLQGSASNLLGDDLVALLAAFMEGEDKPNEATRQPSISTLRVSADARNALYALNDIAVRYMTLEDEICPTLSSPDYWKLSLFWIEPILRWIGGDHMAVICQEYGIFEGNFTRTILKMNNLLDEWSSLATFCQRPEQIESIVEIKSRLVRDIVLPDSLYLRI